MIFCSRHSIVALLLAILVSQGVTPLLAQTNWEVTPYEIEVSVAMEPAPELHERLSQRLCRTVASQSEALIGPAWSVTCTRTPAALSFGCLYRLDELTIEEVEALYPEGLKRDKIIFVAIRPTGSGFSLDVRELDGRARVWARRESRQVLHPDGLLEATVGLVIKAFSPLAQIGKSVDEDDRPGKPKKQFIVRFRAGALVTRADSPILVGAGAVLQPIMRRNDRLGRPKPGGVEPLAWTFLTLLDGDGSERIGQVHSGMRSPISARISRRVDRLALAVTPSPRDTRLQLRASGDEERTLVGYEIYARRPNQDHSEPSDFLGESDFEGGVNVPSGPDPLRILYVKNGGELLARLPIVPGLDETATVSIFDDSLRLEAEGFVRGLQNSLVDRVVEREILIARIRRRIEAGKIDEAGNLLTELRSLKLPSHLAIDLANARQDLIVKATARTQAKINNVFSETEKQLRNYQDARDVEQLTGELEAAARAGANRPAPEPEIDAEAPADPNQPPSES